MIFWPKLNRIRIRPAPAQLAAVQHVRQRPLVVPVPPEVLLCVGLRRLQQVLAGMQVGERADPETVRRMQLGLQEVAAGVAHVGELEDVSGGQEGLEQSGREG